MKILALELSSGKGSIALLDGAETRFHAEFANDRKHSGLFFENLERCMAQFDKPDRIVVGLGPGSYAGTRIAIATAIGLQAITNAELIGLPSFCALPTSESDYAVIGDARRHSFWLAQVSARRCIIPPTLLTEEELRDRLEGIDVPLFSSESLSAFPLAILSYPSALVLAEIAATQPADMTRPPLEPIYLREPHITQPKAA
jgi:tRNA threonylcarbamoyladenosine biosynthesis protein TsaB